MSIQAESARKIFEDIVLSDQVDQTGLVASLCGGNSELENEVNSLLVAYRNANSILDSPFGPADDTCDESAVKVGEQVDDYQILRLIGTGGFGEVYEAKQLAPVQRNVAIKFVRQSISNPDIKRRFDIERQALALLGHPNIAQVLDVGSFHRGRPYFVMELVDGLDVCSFCDQNRLTIRQRIELALTICDAIQHAHQKGIIHRDLKPENILVGFQDGEVVPKVIDFGISKIVANAELHLTRSLAIMGTPQYMSPEQASQSKNVDTRTDIYAIGAILYRLITGESAIQFDASDSNLFDVGRRIREQEPARPSRRVAQTVNSKQAADLRATKRNSLIRTLNGDLDLIVMKSLEKDAGRRYSTVAGFSDDLQRWLNGLPIEARPPSLFYQASRLFHRHRLACSIAICTFVAMVTISIVSVALANIASESQRVAERSNQLLFEILEEPNRRDLGQAIQPVEFYDRVLTKWDAEPSKDGDLSARFFDLLGGKYIDCAAFGRAMRTFQRAVESRSAAGHSWDLKDLRTRCSLAFAKLQLGQHEPAEQELKAIESFIESKPDEFRLRTETRNVLASCKLAQAKLYAQRGNSLLGMQKATEATGIAGDPLLILAAKYEVARMLTKLNPKLALQKAQGNCTLVARHFSDTSFELQKARYNLAVVHFEAKRFQKVQETLKLVMPELERRLMKGHPLLVHGYCYLAWATHGADWTFSNTNLKNATHHKMAMAEENPETTRLYNATLAKFHRHAKQPVAAEKFQRHSMKAVSQMMKGNSQASMNDELNLVFDMIANHRFSAARSVLKRQIGALEKRVARSKDGDQFAEALLTRKFLLFKCSCLENEDETAISTGERLMEEFERYAPKRMMPPVVGQLRCKTLLNLGAIYLRQGHSKGMEYLLQSFDEKFVTKRFKLSFCIQACLNSKEFSKAKLFLDQLRQHDPRSLPEEVFSVRLELHQQLADQASDIESLMPGSDALRDLAERLKADLLSGGSPFSFGLLEESAATLESIAALNSHACDPDPLRSWMEDWRSGKLVPIKAITSKAITSHE